MAQIVIAWSAEKTTAPNVGTTKLANLEDMIGKNTAELVITNLRDAYRF